MTRIIRLHGHLQELLKLKSTALFERLAVELSLRILTTCICCHHDWNIQPSECEANSSFFAAPARQIEKKIVKRIKHFHNMTIILVEPHSLLIVLVYQVFSDLLLRYQNWLI